MNARLSLACGAVLALSSFSFTPAVRAEDPRVVVVIEGSDFLIADLEYLCVDLAGKPKEWENNVFPNIDIFLIGVDGTRPIRYDQLIGGKTGRREQMMVPIEDLNGLINANLAPIGIVVRPVILNKNLFALGGGVYNGWMRIEAGYALFAGVDHLDDIRANMPAPSASHSELMKQGYDAAAQLDNSQTTPEQRTAAFAALRDNTLAGIQGHPDETEAAFALRRLNREQSLETMEQLFVESSLVMIGMTVDSFRDTGTGKFVLEAEPDTPLAGTIQRQAQQPSRFAGVVHRRIRFLAASSFDRGSRFA